MGAAAGGWRGCTYWNTEKKYALVGASREQHRRRICHAPAKKKRERERENSYERAAL